MKMKQLILTLAIALLSTTQLLAQYCTPVYSNACSSADFINNFSTTGGASNITNNNSGCNGALPSNTTFFSALTASQIQGQTITLNMQSGASWGQGFRVWIDWNQNNSFADAGEDVYVSPTSGTGLYTGTITVPFTALPGTTRMRVMCRYATVPLVTDFCATTHSFGEVEDYNFTVIASVGCSGQPEAGTTTSSSANICPATPFSVGLSGNTLASGLTYQWQSSSDGISFTDIVGATNGNYTATQSADTYYQCIVTCTASGLSDISTPILVISNSFLNCYCTSTATNPADEDIFNVSISTMNNSSTCATTGGPGSVQSLYSDYTTTVPAPILAQTVSYNMSIQIGTCGGNFGNSTKVYIDFNQNGVFTDAGEQVYVSPAAVTGPHTITTNITIPATAVIGLTRMRVINVETTVPTSINPCGTYTWGETEDYFVNIVAAPTCPQPTAFSLVSADLTSAEFSWTAGGAETQWQIEYGPVGFIPGTGTIVDFPTNPDTLTGLTSNSFYTAYIRGICGPGDTSYWAGPVNWNTYNQDQFMEWDNTCPTTDFIDISTTGTSITMLDDDEVPLTFPFPILYQGVLYTNGTLGNNGALIFGTTTAQVAAGNLAIGAATTNGLYPFWDDIETAGGVWVDTIGTAPNRQYVIQWRKDLFGAQVGNAVDFELIIDEATLEIFYVYNDVLVGTPAFDNGASATIGVAGPNQDIQVSFNNPNYLTNNSCARFYYTDCPKPTAFTISYIAVDEAAFTWSAGLAAETNWTVIYGPAGFDPATEGITINTSATNATLPNLTQLTQYDVYIYADCSPTLQSNGLFGTFLTLPYCSNPTAVLNTAAVDSIFTSWSWTESSPSYPSTGFNLQYGMSGFELYTGTILPVDNNLTDTIADANLLGGGVYQVYVQAVCGADTSMYIGPFNITMPLTNDTVCGAEMLMADGTVYTFNNTGATVTVGENIIAPPATGLQTTTGWGNSTLNNTTWFKFVAPASGNVRIRNTAINYNGQAAVYSTTTCSDYAEFELLGANDNQIGGVLLAPDFTVCGMTPGETYYLLHDGFTATAGNYSISIIPIVLNAGTITDVINVCSGDTVNLFNGIAGYDNGGIWTGQLASINTGVTDSLFASAGFAYQTFNFEYRLTDGCAFDTTFAKVKIFGPSSAGLDGSLTACRNEPIDLLSGLGGNIDLGGQWYNPSNQPIANSEIITSNIPGQFNYFYISGNGVCPNDTALVLVNVSSTCNYLDVQEMYFGSMSVQPNPSNGVFSVSNYGSTEVFSYEVTDMGGRVILSKESVINGTSETDIDLTGKVTGMYMIRVYNDNAEKVFRVILQ
jgi:hypothetical protein